MYLALKVVIQEALWAQSFDVPLVEIFVGEEADKVSVLVLMVGEQARSRHH